MRSLLALAWRESRFARHHLGLLLGAIALGVGALVAVAAFRVQLDGAIRDGARTLLGADAAVSSRVPFGPRTGALLDSLAAVGADVARTTSFVSMALAPGTQRTRLVRVRAVEPGFPFYGQVETDPTDAWRELQEGRNALVDPGLLTALGVGAGDTIELGEARFRILGRLLKVPGDAEIASALAPRLYIPARLVGETGLVGFGSRIEYEAALRLPQHGSAAGLGKAYGGILRAERASLRTAEQAQAELTRSLRRLGSYLALVGSLALVLGGIAVGTATAAYVARKSESIATLRCLGASSRQVLVVYLLQAGVLGAAGAALGVTLGFAVQHVLARLVAGFLPIGVRPGLDPSSASSGFAIGLWAAVAFALLPIMETRRISPLSALRRRVEPARARGRDPWRWVARLAVIATAAGLFQVQAGSADRAAVFGGGAAVALALLALLAWALRHGLRRLPRDGLPFAFRQGLASLHRPGSQIGVVVPALGLGVFLLATLLVVRHTLLLPIQPAAEDGRASLIVWDVQEDQESKVRALLASRGLPLLQRAPIVPMRIASIQRRNEGERGNDDDPKPRRELSGWALRREYRSTFRDSLVASERILEGRWWAAPSSKTAAARPEARVSGRSPGSPAPGNARPMVSATISEPLPVSMEQGVAQELDVGVGDQITWDVQGVPLETHVASLRAVEWARFEPNFFAVFPPRALEGAPRSWVLLTRAAGPEASASLQLALVDGFPNVSVLDLTQIQRALDDVLGRIVAVIRFLAAFSLAAGFVVLLAAASASRLERLREAVLLKTLGATRRQVATALAVEYLAMGTVAGLAGIALGVGAAWGLARWFFEVPFAVPLRPLLGLEVLTALLVAAIGAGVGGAAYRGTPIEALREE
jgi:putative ABC transport system permease protein